MTFFPWFWSKNGYFFIFFKGIKGQENVFYDILERKNAFLGFKNKKFKIDIVLKGLTQGFGLKNGKEQILDQKSEVFKTSEKSNSLKVLIHGVCEKSELFTKAKKIVFSIFWIEKNTF